MSKSTHFTRQPVYIQVINLLDKAKKHDDEVSPIIKTRHYDSLRELEIGVPMVVQLTSAAIQIQTWTVLIANLLCTIISRKLKRQVSFSQIVTLIRMTLMYYVDLISFLENPNKDELKILSEKEISPHIQLLLFE